MLKLDKIIALAISLFLALAFTWIALVSRDFVLLALAWFVVLLVAGLGVFEERAKGGEEGAT
ncbi:MAG: hypothetical protein ACP5MH_09175 [Thermoproteus sp.]|jgi:hypothetical protein